MQQVANAVTETSGVFLSKFIQDLVDVIGAERVIARSNALQMPLGLPNVMVQKHLNKLTQ